MRCRALRGRPLAAAEALGTMQARLQHVSALEMISSQRLGNLDFARVALDYQFAQIRELC